MLQSLMGPQPGVLVTILDSIWKGWESVRLTASSRAAAASCFQECLCHSLIQVGLHGFSHVHLQLHLDLLPPIQTVF